TGLLGGELAWRQHDGGHEDRSNMKYFIPWANKWIKPAPLAPAESPSQPQSQSNGRSGSARHPQPRTAANSLLAHDHLVKKAKQGGIDLYFVGDSITRRWGCTDPQYLSLLENWKANFVGWNAGNFGWGGDRIENILWRLENGELDGVNPRGIVAPGPRRGPGPWQSGPATPAARRIRAAISPISQRAILVCIASWCAARADVVTDW